MFSGQEQKKGAKTGIDLGEGARRRKEATIGLRQKNRQEQMEALRHRGAGATENEAPSSEAGVWAYNENTKPIHVPRELLPQFVQLVGSPNPKDQYQGTLMIRKLLSVDQSPPIDDVIATGVCPIFVNNFLLRDDFPKLQFEAAWALTNVASGLPQHTTYVMSINAAPALVRLLASPDENCKEQATWALGNLAGDNARCRDYVISLGTVDALLDVLIKPTELIGVHRNATWALSNLCRSKPPPDLEKIASAIPMFVALMSHTDEEIVMDATWALSYISDGSNERVQRILQYAPIPRLVQLLGSSSTALQNPAIRIIGNVVTGSDAQTQLVINAGALQNFHFLLAHPKRGIRKEVCWTLSNITAGTKEQIQAVINANLIPPLLQCMFASEFEVKKEAVWAVANFTCGAAKEQIAYLVQVGGLDQLCDLLGMFDAKIIAVSLEAIDNILGYGELVRRDTSSDTNPYAAALLTNGGLDKLELLQAHSHQEVYHRTNKLLETYFEVGEVSEPTAAVPATESGYQFQAPQAGAFTFDRSEE